MFIAIKDNKIIAHNETGEFPCLVCDEIKKIDDIELVNIGEELLPNTDKKAIKFLNDKKSKEVKEIRNNYLQEIISKVDRYKNQKEIGIETTDTEETYKQYLLYLQYLRDIPQSENFPNEDVKTFEEFIKE